MEAVFYPNTNRTSLWRKDKPWPKWKSELVTLLMFLLFLVSEGRLSLFIISTDGFYTLIVPSNQLLNLGHPLSFSAGGSFLLG